jgi:predicted nucleic acid-binding protein
MIGLDTGFFIRLLENKKEAVRIWQGIVEGEESSVSCLTIFELKRLSMKKAIDEETTGLLIDAILSICEVTWIEGKEILLMGANLSHGLGIPAVDALILAGFLMLNVNTIYTTDSHLELFYKKGIKTLKL